MRKYWWVGISVIIVVAVGIYFWPKRWLNPKGNEVAVKELDLAKYDFDSLKKRGGVASEIRIGGTVPGVEIRRIKKYDFTTREIFFESDGKKISGLINYYPEKNSLSRVIIMIRGYAKRAATIRGTGPGGWRINWRKWVTLRLVWIFWDMPIRMVNLPT